MTQSTLTGVYTAALTPLTDGLEPDLEKVSSHGLWLLEQGCHGVAVLGTTGEANSFSVAQRRAIIDAACGSLPADRLMIGTGTCALADSVELTRAALAGGCPNVLMLPTFYYKNQSDDAVFRTFSEVVQRVADKRLRIYLYHFPQMSATPIKLEVVERLLKAFPGIVVGLKDSSGDWENTATLLRNFPGFAAFSGSERFLLDNLRAGGPGCISATTNVTAPMARKVYDLWRAGSGDADAAQAALTAVRTALQNYPAVASLKFLTARRTADRAWLNLLPPQIDLPQDRRQALLGELEAMEFFTAVPAMAAA